MKVGVVSVTVEQHTEGLQDCQSMLDLDMVGCNAVSADSGGDALESSSVEDASKFNI